MLIDTMSQILMLHQDKTNLLEGLYNAMRFQVDNVAQYLYEELRYQKDKRYSIEERIPNIAPLAPIMWFEYNGSSVGKDVANQYGCLLSIDYDRDNDFRARLWSETVIPDEVRWILRAEYWNKTLPGIMVADWIYYLCVDEEGCFLTVHIEPNRRMGKHTPEDHVPDEVQRKMLHAELINSLLAICFAHCKGANIQEHKPSRQVRRAAERKGEPFFSFHTIDIHSASHALRDEGDIGKNGLAKALHICRGHFAHYTAEKPLFGKYMGTFYRPMHVRGSMEQGIAGKDYRVHSGERG